MSKATKTTLSVIPVTVPWTKASWSGLRVDSITRSTKFLDFLDAWAKKTDSRVALKSVENLSIEYIHGALTAGGMPADKRLVKAMFNRSRLLPETLEIMLDAVREHCGGEAKDVSSAERVALSMFIHNFVSFLMDTGRVNLTKAQRRRLKKGMDALVLTSIAFSIAAINEHFDLTPKDEVRKAA